MINPLPLHTALKEYKTLTNAAIQTFKKNVHDNVNSCCLLARKSKRKPQTNIMKCKFKTWTHDHVNKHKRHMYILKTENLCLSF